MKPSNVWLVSLPSFKPCGPYTDPEQQVESFGVRQFRGYPTLHVLDSEPADRLDLRCVIGTVVHICTVSRKRALELLDRVATFSPAKAIAAGEWGMVGWRPDRGMVEFRV
ncbi:hypothetical protein ACMHYO_16155 [Allopusillimonas ginsengisoli]|uniref:hypothetical protein n=1 Tax=Allopusillimonas ginsengisoli TaxID=453575 RepID=UPI0039C45B37